MRARVFLGILAMTIATMAAFGCAEEDMRKKGYRNPTPARDQKKSHLARVASMGRGNDTELAHVNPREAAILKMLGGSGAINPRSGLREYDDSGDSGFGGNDGSTDTSAADASQSASGPEPGGDDAGNYGGVVSDPSQGPEPGGDDAGNYGGVLSDKALSDMSRSASTPQTGVTGGILGLLSNPLGFLSDPQKHFDLNTQRGFFNSLTALMPGPFGALGNIAMNINDKYFGGQAVPTFGEERGGSPTDQIAALLGTVPSSQPIPQTYSRPDAGAIPPELASIGLGPGMTDLQQRALISTYGTQGQDSASRGEAAKRYYANLLARSLINDNGSAASGQPYVLPVEQLYWQSVLGKTPDIGSASSILNALSSYR